VTASVSRAKLGLLAACLILYKAFKLARPELPSGFLKDSFPSLLFMPAALTAANLAHGFWLKRPSDWGGHPVTILIATAVAAVLLEGFAPLFAQTATRDTGDVVGLAAGGLLHFWLMKWLLKR
jgi:hypothetical protein